MSKGGKARTKELEQGAVVKGNDELMENPFDCKMAGTKVVTGPGLSMARRQAGDWAPRKDDPNSPIPGDDVGYKLAREALAGWFRNGGDPSQPLLAPQGEGQGGDATTEEMKKVYETERKNEMYGPHKHTKETIRLRVEVLHFATGAKMKGYLNGFTQASQKINGMMVGSEADEVIGEIEEYFAKGVRAFRSIVTTAAKMTRFGPNVDAQKDSTPALLGHVAAARRQGMNLPMLQGTEATVAEQLGMRISAPQGSNEPVRWASMPTEVAGGDNLTVREGLWAR